MTTRGSPEREQALLAEIAADRLRRGYPPGGEHHAVCAVATSYLGFKYHQSEELQLATGIDCSTLVSQSHWIGACVGIPFTAEGQRLASSATAVDNIADIAPADVLVRYASRDKSSDGAGNHVGLFLGWDARGHGWLVESRGGVGAILTRIEDFPIEGGIRRFLSARTAPPAVGLDVLGKLANAVPKLGRLGAKQYTSNAGERIVHRGIDLYLAPGTPVFAPASGELSTYPEADEGDLGIEIRTSDLSVRLAQLIASPRTQGSRISTGDAVGWVTAPSSSSCIRYADPAEWGDSHLHVEVEWHSPARAPGSSLLQRENRIYLSFLELAKEGMLGLPTTLDG